MDRACHQWPLSKKDIHLQLNGNYRHVAMTMARTWWPWRSWTWDRGGHGVMLPSIHLLPKWRLGLVKQLDAFAETATPPSG